MNLNKQNSKKAIDTGKMIFRQTWTEGKRMSHCLVEIGLNPSDILVKALNLNMYVASNILAENKTQKFNFSTKQQIYLKQMYKK